MKTRHRHLFATIAMLAVGVAAATADEPVGNLRYSITVSRFDNRAGWSGRWNVGNGFATMLTDGLQQSGNFIVLGDKDMRREALAEQDFAASGRTAGGRRAPQVGRMTPAQLLVRGEVTHVESSTGGGRGGINVRGIRLGGSRESGEVNITMYLVEAETGQVKASTRVVGKSGRRGLRVGYQGSRLGGLTGDLEGFENDNVGQACQDAVDQGIAFLVKQLDSIPWEATVMAVSSGRVTMNRGEREGVVMGRRFQVGKAEELVDPDTGEVLDIDVTTVGRLEVTEVRERIAFLKVIESQGAIERGMTIMPE